MNPMIMGWKAVAEGFGAQLQAVRADQWDNRTPCDEWSVRELVEHTFGAQAMLPGALGTEIDASLSDDPVAQWSQMRDAIEATLSAEGALEQVVASPMGERPVGEIMGLPTNDLLVHTWDLAQAIGNSDVVLNEFAVQHSYDAMLPMDAMLRGKGMFADKVEVPDDASTQDKLIGFLGRQP